MEITLNVRLDMSQAMKETLMKIFSVAPAPRTKTEERMPEQSEQPEPAKPAEIKPAKPARTEPKADKGAETPVSDEELRQAMDMTISKFAGNGWKDSQEPRVLAIKKGCTKAFKEIAKWLGADKPTALEEEKRIEFLERLGEVFIVEDAEGKKLPEMSWSPF